MGRHALCERGIRRLGSREKGFFYRYPDSGDQSRPVAADGGDESRLVESLEEQVRYLRPQLDEAHRSNAEHRRLLAAVLERVPALEAPPEPREASEAASERVAPEYEGRVAAEALRAALVAASVFLRTGVNAKTSLSVYSPTPIATLYGVLVGFFWRRSKVGHKPDTSRALSTSRSFEGFYSTFAGPLRSCTNTNTRVPTKLGKPPTRSATVLSSW